MYRNYIFCSYFNKFHLKKIAKLYKIIQNYTKLHKTEQN